GGQVVAPRGDEHAGGVSARGQVQHALDGPLGPGGGELLRPLGRAVASRRAAASSSAAAAPTPAPAPVGARMAFPDSGLLAFVQVRGLALFGLRRILNGNGARNLWSQGIFGHGLQLTRRAD